MKFLKSVKQKIELNLKKKNLKSKIKHFILRVLPLRQKRIIFEHIYSSKTRNFEAKNCLLLVGNQKNTPKKKQNLLGKSGFFFFFKANFLFCAQPRFLKVQFGLLRAPEILLESFMCFTGLALVCTNPFMFGFGL